MTTTSLFFTTVIFSSIPASLLPHILFFFFFNDTATTEIYTLSLHDALPISCDGDGIRGPLGSVTGRLCGGDRGPALAPHPSRRAARGRNRDFDHGLDFHSSLRRHFHRRIREARRPAAARVAGGGVV